MNDTMISHSPPPWRIEWAEGTGYLVSSDGTKIFHLYAVMTEQNIADAEFIAQAVNCHEELLQALKSCHVACVSCEKSRLPCPYEQAIAKAEGK